MPQLHAIDRAPTAEPAVPAGAAGARGKPQKFAVDVRASRIDGQGAFAAEPIPARRKIGEIRGEAIGAPKAWHAS